MRTKPISSIEDEKRPSAGHHSGDGDWVDRETSASCFADLRLAHRFGKLLSQMSEQIGATVPMACQDWANTKAAYRFFDNDRVSEAEILAGHFVSTKKRLAGVQGLALVLHDMTEFSFQREKEIGLLHRTVNGRNSWGKLKHRTVCGLLMHSSLAVTTEGLPLGLAAVKFWTRKKFKGCNALKKKINPTRVPIEEKESQRWLDNLREATLLLAPSERLGPYRRPRRRHLRTFLCRRRSANELFGPHLRGPIGRGWR